MGVAMAEVRKTTAEREPISSCSTPNEAPAHGCMYESRLVCSDCAIEAKQSTGSVKAWNQPSPTRSSAASTDVMIDDDHLYPHRRRRYLGVIAHLKRGGGEPQGPRMGLRLGGKGARAGPPCWRWGLGLLLGLGLGCLMGQHGGGVSDGLQHFVAVRAKPLPRGRAVLPWCWLLAWFSAVLPWSCVSLWLSYMDAVPHELDRNFRRKTFILLRLSACWSNVTFKAKPFWAY